MTQGIDANGKISEKFSLFPLMGTYYAVARSKSTNADRFGYEKLKKARFLNCLNKNLDGFYHRWNLKQLVCGLINDKSFTCHY